MSGSSHRHSNDSLHFLKYFTQDLAVAAARDSFQKLRTFYVTQYIPRLEDSDEPSYRLRHRFVPDDEPSEPELGFILNRWNYWLNCRELKNNAHFIGVERTAYFLKRAELLASLATHPYDKAGAILKVFKEYRNEVEQKIGRHIAPKHIALRNDMTDFLFTYSRVALNESSRVITDKGPGAVIEKAFSDAKLHEKAEPKKWYFENESKVLTLYSEASPHESVTIAKYMKKSAQLGQLIKKISPESLYLIDWRAGGTQRKLFNTFPRRPSVAFVLEHYLLTNNDETWDREFFVDAVLRKLPDVLHMHRRSNEGSYDSALDDAEEVREIMARKNLHPAMEQEAFDTIWAKVEKKAWSDYLRIREKAFHQLGNEYDTHFISPSLAELRPGLIEEPANIFSSPYETLAMPVKEKLLNRIKPGLGDTYKKILGVQEVLDVSKDQARDMFKNAAKVIDQKPVLNVLDDLGDSLDNIIQ